MKLTQKLDYLQTNHLKEWLSARNRIAGAALDSQGMFCMCGRLASGMHETHCRKLSDFITKSTVRELEHLLPKR